MDDYVKYFYATRGGEPEKFDIGDLSERFQLKKKSVAPCLQGKHRSPGMRAAYHNVSRVVATPVFDQTPSRVTCY